MAVYVDDMEARVYRLKLCHMLADTSEELHAMADAIGVDRKWCQQQGTWREHYDIAKGKRALAIRLGARVLTQREMAKYRHEKRRAAADA